jgi:hypothetical protein
MSQDSVRAPDCGETWRQGDLHEVGVWDASVRDCGASRHSYQLPLPDLESVSFLEEPVRLGPVHGLKHVNTTLIGEVERQAAVLMPSCADFFSARPRW